MRLIGLLGLALASVAPLTAAAQSRFEGWAGLIVAADWRDARGQPIEAFDNARRDLTSGFLAAGFSRETLVDASLRPDVADPTTAVEALDAFQAATQTATKGCLVYITSHGSPDGVVFGPTGRIAPDLMANLLGTACPDRPVVAVISACFSGVFVDGLAAPDRMIVTAARRDRASFGCGAGERYTYFDGCMIEALPTATDFIDLARAAKACVAAREAETGMTPPSEPQVSIGADMQLLLPTLRFSRQPVSAGGTPGS